MRNKILFIIGCAVFIWAGCAHKPVCKNTCDGKQYKSTFYFKPSSADLDLETKEEIKQLAQNMGCEGFRVRLEGHTDISGTTKQNQLLGEKRNQAVKNFIISLGVPEEKIDVISYGETQPADKDYTPQAYSKNRRVEVVFIYDGGTEYSYSSPSDIYVYDGKMQNSYIHSLNALQARQLLEAAHKAKGNQSSPAGVK